MIYVYRWSPSYYMFVNDYDDTVEFPELEYDTNRGEDSVWYMYETGNYKDNICIEIDEDIDDYESLEDVLYRVIEDNDVIGYSIEPDRIEYIGCVSWGGRNHPNREEALDILRELDAV